MTNLPPPPSGDSVPPPPAQPPPGYVAPSPTPGWQVPPTPAAIAHAANQGATVAQSGAGLHLRRAFDWNLRTSVITPGERDQLVAAGITTDHVQRYLAWRKSALLVAVPAISLAALLSIIETARMETGGFSDLGKLLNWLPVLALILVPVGGAIALSKWTDMAMSTRVLQICFVASIVIPVIVALVPVELWLDKGLIRDAVASQEEFATTLLAYRITRSIGYATTLLPTVVSVPSGVMRGALRSKALVPTGQLSGWFLVSIAPIYALVLVIAFVLIEQLVGSILLVLGILLLVMGPLLFLRYRAAYIRPLVSEADRKRLADVVRKGSLVSLAALVLLVLWAITTKVDGVRVVGTSGDSAYFTWLQVIRTAVEYVSRGLIAAVVFAHVVTVMTLRYWQHQRVVPAEAHQEFERDMAEFEQRLGMAP